MKWLVLILCSLSFVIHTNGQNFLYSGQVGGTGGFDFHYALAPNSLITNIVVYSGGFIDGIEIQYHDENGNQGQIRIGEFGGKRSEFRPNRGVKLTAISGKAGRLVDAIQFHFSDGSKTPVYGGKGGESYTFSIPESATTIGFYGKHGNYVDKIGIFYQL